MAKKNQKRKIVGLVSESGERLYYTTRQTAGKKLELRKYDPRTRRHVVLVESTKNLGRNEVKKRK